MHRAVRTQSDNLGDAYSDLVRIDASNGPGNRDMARQEFKQEADINVLLRRFGVVGPPQKEIFFGDVDYGIDLQQALGAIAEAKAAWRSMPADIKADYPTWQSLLNGLEAGQLEIKPESERPPPAPEPVIVTEPLQRAPVTGAPST